eukprot:1435181-Rhodomonas_salina.2
MVYRRLFQLSGTRQQKPKTVTNTPRGERRGRGDWEQAPQPGPERACRGAAHELCMVCILHWSVLSELDRNE